MFNSHIQQSIQIKNSEPPLFFTNFENQVGKYSDGYKKLEGNYEVIDKIIKNKYQYVLILRNIDTGVYDIQWRKECEWYTEHYGARIDNDYCIDKLKVSDKIKDKVLYKDNNYDGYMNYEYGTNLNVAYLAYKGFTTEDAIVISESTAKKMSSYFVDNFYVSVNTNDILTNMYGDKKFYKCFPDIGEYIKDGRLLSRRRIKYDDIVSDLKDLRHVLNTDDVYYIDGKVVDINVYCNSDIEKLKEQDYSRQTYKYIMQQRNFYQQYIDVLHDVVEGKNKCKYTDELLYYYNRYKRFLDNKKCNYQGNLFDNYIIEFTVLEESPVVIGSKISGRYGKLLIN